MPFYGRMPEPAVRALIAITMPDADVDEIIGLLKEFPEAPPLEDLEVWWDEEEAENGGEG